MLIHILQIIVFLELILLCYLCIMISYSLMVSKELKNDKRMIKMEKIPVGIVPSSNKDYGLENTIQYKGCMENYAPEV